MVGQIAADDGLTADILPFDCQHAEAHKAVVDKNRIAGLKLLGEVLVAHGDDRAVAFNIPCCKGEKVAVVNVHLAGFERACAVFGALGVEHDGDGEVKLLAHLLNHADLGKLLFMRAVGKIEAGNVHARPAHGGKNAGVTAGRSDGRDDFCFFHGSVSFHIQHARFRRRSRAKISISKSSTGMTLASFSDKREMRPVKRGVCLKKGTEPSWLCPGCVRTGRNAPASKRIGRAAPYDRLHHSLGWPYFSTK